MSLRVPFTKLPSPNEDEIFLQESFSLIEKEVTNSIKKAQLLTSIGKREESFKYYKAISYYYIMIDYMWYKRKWLIRKGFQCDPKKAENKFKETCVRDNLICISKELDINLTKIYNSLDTLCKNPPPGEFANNEFDKFGFVD